MNIRKRMQARRLGRQLARDFKRDNPDATDEEVKSMVEEEIQGFGFDVETIAVILEAVVEILKLLSELFSGD